MRRLFLSFVITFSVLLLSCGGPSVQHTSIDGSVRQVQNWSIVWKHDQTAIEQPTDMPGLKSNRSRYSLPEVCENYLDQVKEALTEKHGFTFYDNVPVEGTLELTLYGQKIVQLGGTRTDAAKLTDALAERRSPDYERWSAIQEQYVPIGEDDIVKRVDVSILDVQGNVLGQIFIGDDFASKVKADHVAKAVAKAIETGGLPADK